MTTSPKKSPTTAPTVEGPDVKPQSRGNHEMNSTPTSRLFRVVGDSMVSPTDSEPSFPEGDIIEVDPAAQVLPSDFVVAKNIGTGAVMFRRLVLEAGQQFLHALNHAFKPIAYDRHSFELIGRVVATQAEVSL